MKVSQFCVYFYPAIRPADPFGIRTRDSPMDFLFRKSFSLSLKSSVVLAFIFKEDHRESNVSSKPYVSEKMIDQVFLRYYQAGIRTCSVSELVRGTKRDLSQWL